MLDPRRLRTPGQWTAAVVLVVGLTVALVAWGLGHRVRVAESGGARRVRGGRDVEPGLPDPRRRALCPARLAGAPPPVVPARPRGLRDRPVPGRPLRRLPRQARGRATTTTRSTTSPLPTSR
ncbi:hypothetical protein G5V59_12330 [Nocardioides sp. W3-2-3]|uniref:hypothetical protein n=1 Tax=Nocardioides convexus TaxID=2712224 RepID=UPI00241823CD|nr:hypothetical protein [Nocardioides convexus]NHA00546.1 hypothetical protein [Nocardioides convexus]